MNDRVNLADYQNEYPRNYLPLDPEKGARDRFEHACELITRSIPFQLSWSDGKGSYEPALRDPLIYGLKPGEIAKSITPGQRRLIFIGTLHGPVMVSERFMPKDRRGQVYLCNTTLKVELAYDAHFEQHGLRGPLSAHAMLVLLGEDPLTENIGHTLTYLTSLSVL